MIERINRTVNDMLSKYIKRHQKDWDDHLDFIIMAYNVMPHESTGLTPHRLVVISLSFSTMTHGPVQCRTILDLRPGAFLF
jgi:hypothetical protein